MPKTSSGRDYKDAIKALEEEVANHQEKMAHHQDRIDELQAAIAKLRSVSDDQLSEHQKIYARTDGLPPYGGG